jgi:hypothetical protein
LKILKVINNYMNIGMSAEKIHFYTECVTDLD